MMADEEVRIQIEADPSKFTQGLKKARKAVDGFRKGNNDAGNASQNAMDRIGESLDKLKKEFGGIGEAIEGPNTSAIKFAAIGSAVIAILKRIGDLAIQMGRKLAAAFSASFPSIAAYASDVLSSMKDIASGFAKETGKVVEESTESMGILGKLGVKLGSKLGGIGKKLIGVLGKLGGPVGLAIAAILGGIVIGLKKSYDISKKTSKLYDPVRFDKSTTKLQKSLRTLKTSVGAVFMPIYEAMNSVMSTLAGWLNGFIEAFATMMGYIQGLIGMLGSMEASLNSSADAMEEAGAEAAEGLASFDKLTTLGNTEIGDMKQAERMNEIMLESAKAGQRMRDRLKDSLDISKQMAIASANIGASWDGFTSRVGNWWGNVSTDTGTFFEGIGTSLGNIWTTIKTKVGEIWTTIKTKVGEIGGRVIESLKGAWDWLVEKVGEIPGKFKEAFEKAVEKFKELFTGAFDWLGEKFDGFSDSFQDWKNAHGLNWSQGIQMPHLASGGVFEPNNPTLAIIGDNTKEREIASPVSTMKQAFREVLTEAGNTGQNGPIDITLELDGRKLARASYEYMRMEAARRGTNGAW